MMQRTRMNCLWLIFALFWLITPSARAQEPAAPFLAITAVDTTQAPRIQITLVGGSQASEPPEIYEADEEMQLLNHQTTTAALQLAVALDPNGLFTPGPSGQPYHAEVIGAVLDLIETQVVTRNLDSLAAYTLLPYSELATIQPWTQEPNLIFNSIVQYPLDEESTDAPLTDLLLQVLDSFPPAGQPPAPRALILFTAGAERIDMDEVLAKAQAQNVQIHPVVIGNALPSAAPVQALQQLATETQGQFVLLATAQRLQPLWTRLVELHTRHTLVYEATHPGTATVRVRLTLPDGSSVEATHARAPIKVVSAPTVQATRSDTAIAAAATQTPANTPTVQPTATAAAASTRVIKPTATALATTLPTEVATEIATAAELAATSVPTTAVSASNAEATSAPTVEPTAVVAADTIAATPTETEAVAVAQALTATAATTASTSAVEATPDATLAPTTVSTEVTSSSAETTPATLTPVLRSLLWAIPLLLVALGYGIYRSWRTSSGQASRPRRSAPADPYALSETTNADEKLLPSNRPKPAAGNARTKDNLQTHAAEPVSEPLPRPLPPADDEATFVPTYGLGDDEATYRLTEEIEQPIIGYFVRVTSNPALPAELPIYGLNPGPGEVRQIHIGRHSKNNTVVINDNSISREHAAIVQRDGRLYLRDNASTAGTFLNWRRLRPGEELLLRHNDLVSFGEIVYEFRAKGEDEATVAAE